MKKLLIVLIAAIVLLFVLSPSLLGFSLLHTSHAVKVSTSMSAKLACSSKFVSGFKQERIIKDLASYSPVVNLLELDYDLQNKRVVASLFGLAKRVAQYRDGVGCSLLSEQSASMDGVELAQIASKQALWPRGEQVKLEPLIQEYLQGLLQADNANGYQTRALVVIKDGQLQAEAYAEGVQAETKLLGWSMAKSATAVLIGRLQLQQKIPSSQRPLFAKWQGDKRNKIELEHLLQMTSGLDFDETYRPGSDATQMLFTADSGSSVALRSPASHVAGQHFSYSSGTTNLLSRYISKQLGDQPQQVQNYVQQQLFTPLAMANSEFEMDASGVMVGSSYLYASARDWARLGWLMVNQGKINGQRVLSRNWVNKATTPNSSRNEPRYGYQFWLNRGGEQLRWPQLPPDAYAMLGNRKQSVMMIPSKRVVLVRLGWTSGDYPMAENYNKLLALLGSTDQH